MYVSWDVTDMSHRRVQVLRPGTDILDEDHPSSDHQGLKEHALFIKIDEPMLLITQMRAVDRMDMP
jgi:hypothetical protein